MKLVPRGRCPVQGEGCVTLGPAVLAWAPAGSSVRQSDLDALGAVDRARAAGFGADRLAGFVRGRALITGLVTALFPEVSAWSVGTGPCRRCGGPHGAVQVSGVPVVVGVSYAAGLVVAAAAPIGWATGLGIDVELDHADATRRLDLQRLLGPSAEPVLRRWTRVEAVVKADGRGLQVDPADVVLWPGGGSIRGAKETYEVAEVVGPPGYLISLALRAGASATLPGRATR